MFHRSLNILGLLAFAFAFLPAAASAKESYRLHVVNEKNAPVPRFQAMLYAGKADNTGWIAGTQGAASFPAFEHDPPLVHVLARAGDYAPAVLSLEGAALEKLKTGTATITMSQGEQVALRFQLPSDAALPETIHPEVYFDFSKERIYALRRLTDKQRAEQPDFKLFEVRRTDPGKFEFRIAHDAPAFYVGLRARGFPQSCDLGPFSLADAKNGALEIPVPGPAGLEIHFDPGAGDADKLPFRGVSCAVMWKIPGHGDSMLPIAEKSSETTKLDLRVTDLKPGDYYVVIRTKPKPDAQIVPNTAKDNEPQSGINPGAFHDQKILSLKRGRIEKLVFQFTSFDLEAHRGDRTAVLRIEKPDGSPAAGGKITVCHLDGNYGSVPIFSGELPSSGEITLKNLSDRKPPIAGWERGHYDVRREDKSLGYFDFSRADPIETFVFRLPCKAGDRAPDVELFDVTAEKTIHLRDLRGKVVLLEFWTTWCGPCQPAMEKLDSLAREHAEDWEKQVLIVPVNIDESVEILKKHVAQRGWNHLTHYWAGDKGHTGFDSSAMRAFVGDGVPDSILIGPEGRILWRGHPLDDHDGQDLKTRIKAAMKK